MDILPRVRWQTRVSDGLTLMAYLIKARSRVGMNDASVALEAIVARLLNELNGWNLMNLNSAGPTFPAADLGDKSKREAVQVTIQDSGTKISHTIEKALEHRIGDDYDRLTIFFLLPKKPAFPKGLKLPPGIAIETLDIADLTNRVGQISDIAKLERVAKIVEDEVGRSLHAYRSGDEPRPQLHARFHEDEGGLVSRKRGKYITYWMSLWVEDAPRHTQKVLFDILHESFEESTWEIRRERKQSTREFMTDDMSSYGDVDIWLRGIVGRDPDWRLRTTLYEALVNHYGLAPADGAVAKAMAYIRDH